MLKGDTTVSTHYFICPHFIREDHHLSNNSCVTYPEEEPFLSVHQRSTHDLPTLTSSTLHDHSKCSINKSHPFLPSKATNNDTHPPHARRAKHLPPHDHHPPSPTSSSQSPSSYPSASAKSSPSTAKCSFPLAPLRTPLP